MPKSKGLNHIAMSVPRGTLTDDHVAELCDFYGAHLGWQVLEGYRQEDRLTLAAGGRTYVNIRERDDVMVCHGYEHFGVTPRIGGGHRAAVARSPRRRPGRRGRRTRDGRGRLSRLPVPLPAAVDRGGAVPAGG